MSEQTQFQQTMRLGEELGWFVEMVPVSKNGIDYEVPAVFWDDFVAMQAENARLRDSRRRLVWAYQVVRGCEKEQERYDAEWANLEAERALWEQRANNLLDIAKAASAIVASPYQLYESRGYSGSYLVNKSDFEALQRAVEAAKKASAEEGR